jgi:hypothetical protein
MDVGVPVGGWRGTILIEGSTLTGEYRGAAAAVLPLPLGTMLLVSEPFRICGRRSFRRHP